MDIFYSEEFKKLKSEGACVQRPLWASTGTKNPAYSETKYITELIAKETVNTTPENTMEAFMAKGSFEEALTGDTSEAEKTIGRLAGAGIDMDKICESLLAEGVKAFVMSFESLLESIQEKAGA